jgi:ABC-2 type transport system permease protein
MTFLIPFLLVTTLLLPFSLSGTKYAEVKHIAVIDHTGKYTDVFLPDENYRFHYLTSEASVYPGDEFYALIVIAEDPAINSSGITLYSDHYISPELTAYLSGMLNAFIEEKKLERYNIPYLKEIIDDTRSDITIRSTPWSVAENAEASPESAMLIGLFATFLIYFFIIIYGSQVMRGVSEEKSSRIVEIIISSVKPFDLMMGKITGIALVGLTQFLIWIVFVFFIVAFSGDWLADFFVSDLQHGIIFKSLSDFDFGKIGFFFVIYFLGGYLLYASLFAAIGAASDPETDSQQFLMPVTLPIFLAFFAAIYTLNNPDSEVAFWTSIIPFTSPVVMMVRIPMGVSWWELILSISLLVITFVLTTKLAARIYRTGILIYGKKIGYKEIRKWLKYK